MNLIKNLHNLIVSKPTRRASFRPVVESLEDRCCPSGDWYWTAPAAGGSWSNATGANWSHNGAQAPANNYPGMAGSTGDQVFFDNANTGPATLDLALPNPINTLYINGWNDRLTLNNPLTVAGGNFVLTDTTTINIGANLFLSLSALASWQGGYNPWTNGTITGGANSSFKVVNSQLGISGTPVALGTNMVISDGGLVVLANMTNNLDLTAASNYIDIKTTAALWLNQVISANGQQNSQGGIAYGPAHSATAAAIVVDTGGGNFLERGGTAAAGVADQVMVAGAVYNIGGHVEIKAGTMLNITGVDTGNRSYWQQTGGIDLSVETGANINASGTYQIDTGTVSLTTGGASLDRLDGAGLIFSSLNPTTLAIVDATSGTPGTVTVKGKVTLASTTTTTMSFIGASNTADLLDVQNGALILMGDLVLTSIDRKKPSVPLNFFDDSGANPSIKDLGILISDNIGGMDTGKVVTQNANLLYYQVTIK